MENKKRKHKSLLSEDVKEVLRNDKLDFTKQVEAVGNNKLPCDLSGIDDAYILIITETLTMKNTLINT